MTCAAMKGGRETKEGEGGGKDEEERKGGTQKDVERLPEDDKLVLVRADPTAANTRKRTRTRARRGPGERTRSTAQRRPYSIPRSTHAKDAYLDLRGCARRCRRRRCGRARRRGSPAAWGGAAAVFALHLVEVELGVDSHPLLRFLARQFHIVLEVRPEHGRVVAL